MDTVQSRLQVSSEFYDSIHIALPPGEGAPAPGVLKFHTTTSPHLTAKLPAAYSSARPHRAEHDIGNVSSMVDVDSERYRGVPEPVLRNYAELLSQVRGPRMPPSEMQSHEYSQLFSLRWQRPEGCAGSRLGCYGKGSSPGATPCLRHQTWQTRSACPMPFVQARCTYSNNAGGGSAGGTWSNGTQEQPGPAVSKLRWGQQVKKVLQPIAALVKDVNDDNDMAVYTLLENMLDQLEGDLEAGLG